MRVKIDPEKCQGHGMCTLMCPEVFEPDDEGYGHVVPALETVPAELEESVRLAEAQCPEQAIHIIDGGDGA